MEKGSFETNWKLSLNTLVVVSVFLRRSNRRFRSTETSITSNKRSLIGGRVQAPADQIVKGEYLQKQSAIWVRVKSIDIQTLGLVISTKIRRQGPPSSF